jgi:hypothetical protein
VPLASFASAAFAESASAARHVRNSAESYADWRYASRRFSRRSDTILPIRSAESQIATSEPAAPNIARPHRRMTINYRDRVAPLARDAHVIFIGIIKNQHEPLTAIKVSRRINKP